jgi:crotonobetaine/carnitine-CoA ligase
MAARHGERPCLHFLHDGTKLNYREFELATNRLANGLKAIGLGHGSHVAVLSDNRLEQLFAYFAVAKIGGASVPVVTAAKGYFLQRFIGNSECTAIIAEPEFLPNLAGVVEDLPLLDTLVILPSLESVAPPPLPDELRSLRLTDFTTLMAASDAPVDDAKPSDRAQILYTSGTTGPSKGAEYPNSAILAWGWQSARSRGYGPDDVALNAFPLFHAGSWLTLVMPMFWAGGSVAVARRFSASRFLEQARESQATVAAVVAVAAFLAAQPPSPADRDHRLWQVTTAPPPPDPRAFEERFGLRLTSGFALSDYGSSHALTVDAPHEKLGSAGRLKDDWEMRVVDDDDFDVPEGQTGELLLRCNIPGGAPTGYYKMPEATLESRRNLWFHTGDYVRVDADGYMWFVDRKKDAIRRRGENISSYELEMVLNRHPAVTAAAFFPVNPHGTEEEVAVALLVTEGQPVTEAEIVEFCAREMPKFAVPRYVRFVGAFPQTGSGKIQKRTLRAETEAALPDVWDREAQRATAVSRS